MYFTSGLSAAVASVAPKKLNALEQLELLRQQQEQLQQLQKLESRLKHGSISSLPSATTAPAAAPRLGSSVATKPHSATTQESWSHSSAESQSTHISEKPAAAVQSKGVSRLSNWCRVCTSQKKIWLKFFFYPLTSRVKPWLSLYKNDFVMQRVYTDKLTRNRFSVQNKTAREPK